MLETNMHMSIELFKPDAVDANYNVSDGYQGHVGVQSHSSRMEIVEPELDGNSYYLRAPIRRTSLVEGANSRGCVLVNAT